MKNLVSKAIAVLVLTGMIGATAWAESKNEKVTFTRDVVVNGTLVKKGVYKMVFDEKSGELTLWSGKTMVAKSPAHTQTRTIKAINNEMRVTSKDNASVLRSLTFAGDTQNLIINDTENQAVTPQ
jgi:hypothetical protein